jgi:hypothetical protein
MTKSYLATILALAIGIALCLAATCGPARADIVSAMRALCGSRGVEIAKHVDHFAGYFHLTPLLLGALVSSESGCHVYATSKSGKDLGLGQLRVGGSAAYGWPRKYLFDPEVNLFLTAKHLRRWLDKCSGYVPGALSGYRGLRGCKDSKGSQRVLRLVRQAEAAEARS